MILSNPNARTAAEDQARAPGQAPDQAPGQDAEHPWALTAVAAIFLVGGLTATWDFGSSGGLGSIGGGRGNLYLNFGILALPVGIGLLRRRPGWRTVALVFTGLNAVGVLAAAVASIVGVGQFTLRISGRDNVPLSESWHGSLALGFLAAVFGWMMYILLRPDTRKRFQDHRSDRRWIEWSALVALLVVAYLF